MSVMCSYAITVVLMILIFTVIGSLAISAIFLWVQLPEIKEEPFHQVHIMKFIVSSGIKLLAVIFLFFLLNYIDAISQGGDILSEAWLNILVNIGTSVIVTVITSIGVYFKFLKKLPDETKNKIDKLLNERLQHEAVNHNAALQKSDTLRESLSREHSELSKSISDVRLGVNSMQSDLENERRMKELAYSRLSSGEKLIVDSIDNLSAMGERMKILNLENEQLLSQVETLQAENAQLHMERK